MILRIKNLRVVKYNKNNYWILSRFKCRDYITRLEERVSFLTTYSSRLLEQ